jgi:hypothetical protein
MDSRFRGNGARDEMVLILLTGVILISLKYIYIAGYSVDIPLCCSQLQILLLAFWSFPPCDPLNSSFHYLYATL